MDQKIGRLLKIETLSIDLKTGPNERKVAYITFILSLYIAFNQSNTFSFFSALSFVSNFDLNTGSIKLIWAIENSVI